MSQHGVLSVAIQVKKIDTLSDQKFGFQQQLIDVAENLYLNTLGRCDIHAGRLFLGQLKTYHIARDRNLQRDRVKHDRAVACARRAAARARAAGCVMTDARDVSEGEDSGGKDSGGEDNDGSLYVNLSGSSNSRFSTDAVVDNNGNNRPPEMISLLDDDDDEEVGIKE